jgi:hypothetical protein
MITLDRPEVILLHDSQPEPEKMLKILVMNDNHTLMGTVVLVLIKCNFGLTRELSEADFTVLLYFHLLLISCLAYPS